MNVASLELCRELYELSGWIPEDQVGSYYMGGGGHYVKGTGVTVPLNPSLQLPAYDLGYLLRKLTSGASWFATLKVTYYDPTDEWYVEYSLLALNASDTTPENSACKLAIELFKQGILTREEK